MVNFFGGEGLIEVKPEGFFTLFKGGFKTPSVVGLGPLTFDLLTGEVVDVEAGFSMILAGEVVLVFVATLPGDTATFESFLSGESFESVLAVVEIFFAGKILLGDSPEADEGLTFAAVLIPAVLLIAELSIFFGDASLTGDFVTVFPGEVKVEIFVFFVGDCLVLTLDGDTGLGATSGFLVAIFVVVPFAMPVLIPAAVPLPEILEPTTDVLGGEIAFDLTIPSEIFSL